jgi:hypothetical protein
VKTRLAEALGPELAAEVYRVLADEEIRLTAPREGEYERVFLFAPAEARAAVQQWLPGQTLAPQRGADLGERMANAFEDAFRSGARRAVLIGSDVPSLSRDDVCEAFEAVEEHGVVVGPASDGGYYLVALDRPRPSLFRDVAWSTPSVFASSIQRAGALGLDVHVLRTLSDVDTIDDLRGQWTGLRRLFTRERAAAVEAALP